MIITFIGNFDVPYCTENHHRLTLEKMGHTVIPFREGKATIKDILPSALKSDLVLYTHTHSWGIGTWHETIEFFAKLKVHGVPTAGYHLDLWMGLKREADLIKDPYWGIEHFFTVDKLMADWLNENNKTKGYFLPPGVFEGGCYLGTPNKVKYPHDIIFVGSKGYHPEWNYRPQLIEWLHKTYGDRFAQWGGGGLGTIREAELNNLYASAKVVVGDSLCLNFDYPYYSCVDEETEILTRSGWKKYSSLLIGEDVYSINPETKNGEWVPVLDLFISPEESRVMRHINGSSHSSLTTLNHKWMIESPAIKRTCVPMDACPECGYVSGNLTPRSISIHRALAHDVVVEKPKIKSFFKSSFKTTEELKQNDRFPIAAQCQNLPITKKYCDEFVELVGWAWTEGSFRKRSQCYEVIYQSHKANPQKVLRIKNIFLSMFGNPVEDLKKYRFKNVFAWKIREYNGITHFLINKKISDELMSVAPAHIIKESFINDLTIDQLILLIDVSVMADGSIKRYLDKRTDKVYDEKSIAQKIKSSLYPLEMAAALCGVATSMSKATGDMNRICFKKRKNCAPLKPSNNLVTDEMVIHSGRVWCPTTKNKTWLAKRNGHVYFTGNSDRIYETTGRGGFLIHPKIKGLELMFNDNEMVYYNYGDFEGLKNLIDYYCDHDEERESIRMAAHNRTKTTHTYFNRLQSLLDTLNLK